MKRFTPILTFVSCFLLLCALGCQPSAPTAPAPTPPPSTEPDAPVEPDQPPQSGANGLSNLVFDNCIRIRTNGGMGSGSVVGETASDYILDSNHHVSSKGTPNNLDVFIGGHQMASVRTVTAKSWFANGKNVDVSEIRIPKSSLGGPLPVVEYAPAGYDAKLKPGQPIYTHGCANGRWPHARFGHIHKVEGGLIWYLPESVPGDSGSAVYVFDVDLGKWFVIGRTAWYTELNGKRYGLAMTSDRVLGIKSGQVSNDLPLPEGTCEIEPAELDENEVHEVSFRRWRAQPDWEPQSSNGAPAPIFRFRQQGMNFRSGLGFGVMFLGLSVGVCVILYTVYVLRR